MTVKTKFLTTAVAAGLLGLSAGASANLVLNGQVAVGAQGFGNAHRLLTISSKGNSTSESGAIGISGGTLVALTPGILDSAVFSGNGVSNAGGDTVNPLTDNLKFGIPTLGELGWTSGSNVNLLFNASESGGDGLTVTDVTLKFYDSDSVIAAIDGSFNLLSTVTGAGNAGFLVSVDVPQQVYLDSVVFNQAGASAFRIALESTITGVSGGPESFSAITAVSAIPEPGTHAMMLAGLGLLGFAARHRRSRR